MGDRVDTDLTPQVEMPRRLTTSWHIVLYIELYFDIVI